jgi:hypothetical protein
VFFFCFVCVHFLLCDHCCLYLDCPFLITPLFVFVFCFVTNVACVWIVHSWLHLCLCSFSVLWPMLPVSRLSILDYTFVCVRFLFCDQCCLYLDCPFLITPLFVFVFCFVTNVACVWIVHSWLHLCLCSFSVLWPMLPVSGLSILDYTLFVFVFCFVTNVRGKTSWHKGLHMASMNYFDSNM